MTETRHRRYYERIQWERAIVRDIRRSMPRGDALLALYATKSAKRIAYDYSVKEWWVRECIRQARECVAGVAGQARGHSDAGADERSGVLGAVADSGVAQ